jgi:hypothetical protein
MSCRFDDLDREILEFRPDITFVEPDAEPATPNPVDAPIEKLQLEEIESERERIKQIAKAVNALATATQARLDERAKDMVVQLDTNIDQDVIQALRRKGADDPTVITYEQYRECRDNIRNKGISIAAQATTTPELVAQAKEAALKAGPNAGSQLGGFGTEEAAKGGLRPELDTRATIIPPLNVEEFQIDMICILVNFIWKVFIKPIFKPIAIPPPFGPSLADLLPDRLCDPGIPLNIPGLFILGDKPDDLLKGVIAQQAKESIDQGVNIDPGSNQ